MVIKCEISNFILNSCVYLIKFSVQYRNMWNVWRTVLEENEKLARARLAAVEVFQQQIADDAKILRAHKGQMSRKVRNSVPFALDFY